MTDIEVLAREAFRRRDAHDLDGFLELLADDCEWRMPGASARGPAEVRALLEPFYGSFSGDRHDIDRVDAIGSRAYVEGRWHARHTGTLPTLGGELPATGVAIELPFAIVVEGDGSGRARSVRAYWDGQALAGQLAAPGAFDPAAVVREGFRRMDAGDARAFAELMAPDVDFVIPGGSASTPDEVAALVGTYVDAFPDGRHEAVRLESFGDTALVEGWWSGTNSGPLRFPDGELPPTGVTVRFRFGAMLRVRDGKVVSLHNYFDQLDLLGQLGLVPLAARA